MQAKKIVSEKMYTSFITVALNMLHDCCGLMVKDLLYSKLLLLKFYFKTLSNGLVCV